jgi:hypothetical protein
MPNITFIHDDLLSPFSIIFITLQIHIHQENKVVKETQVLFM